MKKKSYMLIACLMGSLSGNNLFAGAEPAAQIGVAQPASVSADMQSSHHRAQLDWQKEREAKKKEKKEKSQEQKKEMAVMAGVTLVTAVLAEKRYQQSPDDSDGTQVGGDAE